MTKVSAAVMEAFAPTYKAYNLPYLFENEEHRLAVMNGPLGREVLQDGRQYWLRGLCYYDAGYRSFYTVSKPVREPGDLAGMKIRTQESPTAIRGTFMDMTPAVLIFTPIFLPAAAKIGIDPVHFEIIMVLNLCIGLCTPPVGSCLFVGCGVAGAR